jgi:hypothetical protein
MSLQNIEVPNDLTLYCGTLNATNIDVENITLTNNLILDGVLSFPQVVEDGIMLPSVGGTQQLLNAYDQQTLITTMTGPWTSPPAVTFECQRIGDITVLNFFGAVAGVTPTTATISVTAAIPARYCPADTLSFIVHVFTGTGDATGVMFIQPGGEITFKLIGGGNWTGTAGVDSFGISYNQF